MLIKVNLPTLVNCDATYEQKLVDKALVRYLEDKARRNSKPQKRLASDALSEGLRSEDTFVPVPSSAFISADVVNELLSNEDFCQPSYSDVESNNSNTSDSDTDVGECDDGVDWI